MADLTVTPSGSTLLPSPVGFVGKLCDVAAEYLSAVVAELEAAHWEGASGADTAVRYTTAVDNLVRFMFEAASERFSRRYARAHQRCAVIAQGSYGRRELNPRSDLDILVVYPNTMNPYVETIAESLFYALWDAGVQVGNSVRSFKQCSDLAGGDLTIKTSILDGRMVCGSVEVATEFRDKVQEVVASTDVDGFVRAKIEEFRGRHAEYGGSVFMLEPNVKEADGGLRDLHTVLWIARVKAGARSLEDLAEKDFLSEAELAELLAARDFLLRVRHSLHFLTKAKQDALTFERQDLIAERFGYRADAANTAADVFMRDYYRHAALLARVSEDLTERWSDAPEAPGLIERLTGRIARDKIKILRGRLVVDESVIDDDAINIVRVMHDAQKWNVDLASATREMLRRKTGLLSSEVVESAAAVAALFDILRWKERVYPTLAEMNRLGILGKMIPEFGRLFCMVQHDAYHVYTVDEHSLMGVRELERLRDGEWAKQSPLLTQIVRECDHPELLFLAMMFHDLGKGYGGDHDERGALMVRDIGKRLRLNHDDRRALEFLVRHHLTMSKLAQTRDIEDAMLVAEFVKLVGNPGNLRNLYLVTFADMKAVGPKVWSGWKDHLLGELYRRSVEMFDKGLVTEADLERRVERIGRRLAARASVGADRRSVEGFVSVMPAPYILSTSAESLYDHWQLYRSLGDRSARCHVVHYPERGFSEFSVCTPDRPGRFVRITGVLLAHGLSVVSARIGASSDGIAIDAFRIDHAEDGTSVMDPERWTEVRETLDGVLKGAIDVDILVADARRASEQHLLAQKAKRRIVPRVEIDNQVSARYTVVDLYASDRLGLLFTVASCLYHLGLTIHLAKITTQVDRVLDVFYVTDADGRKVEDPERLDEIRVMTLETLGEPAGGDGASQRQSA